MLVAGGTVVNINPLYTPRELSAQLNDSGARILFVLENFAHTVAEAMPGVALDRVVLAGPGDGLGLKGKVIDLASRHLKKAVPAFVLPPGKAVRLDAVMRQGRGLPAPTVAMAQDDLAFLQYTGGTTGIAKAAMLTHRNIMVNVAQSQVWFEGIDEPGRVMVTALPLYHIFALTCCFFFFMRTGGSCLLIPNPRDGDGFVKTLSKTRFTHFSGVNTLFNLLNNHPKIGTVDFSQLDYVVAGGMAVQSAVAARWKAITGKTIIEGYGLSETSPVVCVNPYRLEQWSRHDRLPAALDRRVDPRLRRDAGPGRHPRRNLRARTAGDEGVLEAPRRDRFGHDGGRILPHRRRRRDGVGRAGADRRPDEGHDPRLRLQRVSERGRGRPDDASRRARMRRRRRPACRDRGDGGAHVVLRDAALTPEAIRAYARTQLTGYKVPRQVVLHQSLPKTNVGKVLRRALRGEAPPA